MDLVLCGTRIKLDNQREGVAYVLLDAKWLEIDI